MNGAVERFGAPLLVLALAAFGVARTQTETNAPFAISDPRNVTALVARVGEISITAQQFLLSYEFGPGFVKRENDSRKRHLDFMIDEKLLALDAYVRHWDTLDLARRSLAEIEGDLATEELYKDDVLSKAKVTDTEVERGVAQQRKHFVLRWLFSKSFPESQQAVDLINRGTPFDSLYNRQLTDSIKPEERSLESNRFVLGQKNPVIAQIADTLKPGRVSSPVKGPDGWYVFKLLDGWTDVLPTESDVMKMRVDVQRALLQQRADSLSDRYVLRLMESERPELVKETFQVLTAFIARKVLTRQEQSAWGVPDSINVDRVEGRRRDKLVSLKSGSLSMGEFLLWYGGRETLIRLPKTSLPAFTYALEQVVWRMVRDRLLVDRAMRRGLQKRQIVTAQKKWWQEKILYAMAKKAITDSIRLSDAQVRKYFELYQHRYLNAKGVQLTFDDAKDQVRRDLFQLELSQRLFHRLVTLRRRYPVEINEETLRRLPLDVENSPKAIDVYAVKKGGTFPHPAFPTIDFDWQMWQ